MRFMSRHVIKTIQDFAAAELLSKGWITPGSTNFDAEPVVFLIDVPDMPIDLPENLVLADVDGPSSKIEVEMGGREAVVFGLAFDIYCQNPGVAMSVAEDLKDSFEYKILGLNDYTSSANGVSTGHYIEFDGVELNREGPINRGAERRTLITLITTAEVTVPE